MKYFLHDTNAFHDEKVSQLFIKYGYEGIGLFYTVLERLAAQEKPVSVKVLKMQLHINKRLEKIWRFLEEIKLISTKNGECFNENLLKYSEKYQSRRENTRERVEKWRAQKSETETDTKNVTGYERVSNAVVTPVNKVKEVKKGIEGIFPTPDFEIELSDLDVGKAIEYIHHTKQKDVTKDFIKTLFNVFKTKNFTGAKFYKTKSEIISHFFESIKFEKFELNGTHQSSNRKSNNRGAGEDQLIGGLKKIFNAGGAADFGG